MRIFIAPQIFHPGTDASWYLAKNLALMFTSQGHITAISAPKSVRIPYVSLYPCPSPHRSILKASLSAGTCEQWLYKNGCLSRKYLNEDLDHLLDAVHSFQPDLIISIERPMAEAAARLNHIRCFTRVHPAMYRRRTFPIEYISSLNQILSDHNLAQIISLKDLLRQDALRFGFGPMPFLSDDPILRIGTQQETLNKTQLKNRVCIYLNDVHKSAGSMKKIITEAFHGAPYSIYASFRGSEDEDQENIHFLEKPNPDIIPGSIAVIHDGNDYYTNICLARGIIQVIVANHDFIRLYNGQAVARNKTGRMLYEEDFNMSSLYSTYRTILSDDEYDINAQRLKEETRSYGTLDKLLRYIKTS